MQRYRHWTYPGGVVVTIPADEPDAHPPALLEDVPEHWPRTTVRGKLQPEPDAE